MERGISTVWSQWLFPGCLATNCSRKDRPWPQLPRGPPRPPVPCKGSVPACKTILILTKNSPYAHPTKRQNSRSSLRPETRPSTPLHEPMRDWQPQASLTIYLWLQQISGDIWHPVTLPKTSRPPATESFCSENSSFFSVIILRVYWMKFCKWELSVKSISFNLVLYMPGNHKFYHLLNS